MPSSNDGAEAPAVEPGTSGTERTEAVVVPTGGGERYHRPGVLVYESACKTGFGNPVRETTVEEARQEGFTPCRKPACFGDEDG
jgi:hypothetical protein